jgi:hypothetical protein
MHYLQLNPQLIPHKPSQANLVRAASSTRYIQARSRHLSARNTNLRPCPISTTSTTALNINIRRRALHSPLHIIEHEVLDRDAVRRVASRTVVGLVDDDAVVSDARERDIFVGHAGYGAGVAGDGLDAHAVLRVFDFGAGECYRGDGVVGAATNRSWSLSQFGSTNLSQASWLTDGETVAARADSVGEGDALFTISKEEIMEEGKNEQFPN